MTCERFLDLIDAYVDQEIDPLNARVVEAHVGECAGCARKLAARRALSAALKEKLPYHRAPAGFADLPEFGRAGPRTEGGRSMVKWAYPLAAAILMLAGLSLGWAIFGRGGGANDPMAGVIAAVETDHLRSLQGEHLVDVVSSDKHTVKPWFAGRVAFSPAVPELEGFVLKGGRLDYVDGEPAAALVYMHNKHVINLLIWQGGDVGSAARTTASGHQVVTWRASELNYCAVSDVEAGILNDFAARYRAAGGAGSH